MSRSKGYQFEEIAASYLKQNGYEIIEQNWHASKYGEIDIITIKDDKLIFFEVKGRTGAHSEEDALNSLTPRKLQRIYTSIEIYLAETPFVNHKIQFDVLLIYNGQIEHLENIQLS